MASICKEGEIDWVPDVQERRLFLEKGIGGHFVDHLTDRCTSEFKGQGLKNKQRFWIALNTSF